VVVDHEYLRPPVPVAELGIEPAIVLAPHLTLVEIRLGRIERHDLRLALRYRDRNGQLAHAEEVLEVPVADAPGVMVAHTYHNVRTLEAIQVLLGLLELPSVALHRQVPDDGDEVGLKRVRLLYRPREELGPEETRAHVDI
jgi:hypothetical protein